MGPEKPYDSGNVFVIFTDDEVKGWVPAMTASQALSIAFDHPQHPRYKALIWGHCKQDWLYTALDEGKIEGRIREGCPDCRAEKDALKREIIDKDTQIGDLEVTLAKLHTAFKKQGEELTLLLKSRGPILDKDGNLIERRISNEPEEESIR